MTHNCIKTRTDCIKTEAEKRGEGTNDTNYVVNIPWFLSSFNIISITCVGIIPTFCNARASSLFLGISAINHLFMNRKKPVASTYNYIRWITISQNSSKIILFQQNIQSIPFNRQLPTSIHPELWSIPDVNIFFIFNAISSAL